MILNNSKSSNISNALLIIILFTSVDTLLFGTNQNQAFLYVPRLLCVVGVIALPLLNSGSIRRIKIEKQGMFAFFLLLFFMIVSSIINHENTLTFISRMLTLMLGYSISSNVRREQFYHCFDNAMTVIAISALIMETLAYLIPSLVRSLPKVYNTAGTLHYSFFLSSIYERNNIGNLLIRTSGIFWEPGAFAIYLTFALIIQLFVLERIKVKRVVLYLVALFFTFSTTGFVTVAVLILAYLLSHRSSDLSKYVKMIFAALIAAVLIFSLSVENNELFIRVFGKLTSGTSSATTRYSSIYNGLQVALRHPLFGVASQSQGYMANFVDAYGNPYSSGGYIITNTVVGYTVNYGFIFGFVFVYGHFKFIKQYAKSLFEIIMLLATFMLAYSGERLFSFLPFVFIFYGFINERGNYENSGYKLTS